MTAVAGQGNRTVTELLSVSDEDTDVRWLRSALQTAMVMELATIPPYSCGLWSIVVPPQAREFHRTIREIIFDEMAHFGLVGNMLSAIGGVPDLSHPPTYPGQLPGGVRPELTVSLSGLTTKSLGMYAHIEAPEDQHFPESAAQETYPSIGAFYQKISRTFERCRPELNKGPQLEFPLSGRHGTGNDIVVMKDLDTVLDSLDIVMEQGEGTSATPGNPYPGYEDELAHYYSFRQLELGRKLVRKDGEWVFEGDRITRPKAYPAAEVPAGGWAKDPRNKPEAGSEARQYLDWFNAAYSSLLNSFQKAWGTTDKATRDRLVGDAIQAMADMREYARLIMAIPLKAGPGNYCPEFLYVPAGH
ncbi:ferritin-like domain-containing protein [Actinophytocola oryzae]|uniref:Ferritin-like protein n=1 Tax=Actinophytocola oryzae TaxID=502181 RepID=A0A4V3FV11_9PSEU|nr:ferritin-like protein [Actinophytocola oryzae]TDV57301.1 ferritin-like protein [Actinophytocola oryzae]